MLTLESLRFSVLIEVSFFVRTLPIYTKMYCCVWYTYYV